MISTRIACTLALPLLSAGIIGAALGLAGTANADTDSAITTPTMFATPQTYADPTVTVIPWGEWLGATHVNVPHVDTSVHQSR
jgi:hypothetical protein